jgi:hypothetical protein
MVLNAPVRNKAALSTNMKATVMVAWSLNPFRASFGVITPLPTSTISISSATRSMLSFSEMNRISAPTMVAKTIHSWGLMRRVCG